LADRLSPAPENGPFTSRWRTFSRLLLTLLFGVTALAIGLILFDAYSEGQFSGGWLVSLLHLIFGLIVVELLCLPPLFLWITRARARRRGRPASQQQLSMRQAAIPIQRLLGVMFLSFWLVTLTNLEFDLPLIICAVTCLSAALIILSLKDWWAVKNTGEVAPPSFGGSSGSLPDVYPSAEPTPAPGQRRVSRRAVIVGIAGLGAGVATAIAFPRWLSLRPRAHFGDGGGMWTVAWSGDGSRIAAAGSKAIVYILNPLTGATTLAYQGHANQLGHPGVISVTWAPDGQRVASADTVGSAQVWDTATGRTLLVYTKSDETPYSVAWSPDGQHIASGADSGFARIWDATTGTDVMTFAFPSANAIPGNAVNAVAWSPDGSYIAAASSDSTVRIIDVVTGLAKLIYRGHTSRVVCVAWSPDGRFIASGADDVQVWDAATGQQIVTYHGHTGGVSGLTWASDSVHIASSGADDGTVQIWNAASGARSMTYRGHFELSGLSTVNAVAWSAEAQMIASAGGDVQIWTPA